MIPLTTEKELFLTSMKIAKQKGVGYQDLEDEIFTGKKVRIRGKDVLNFSNCCYLGLENHPQIVQGIIQTTQRYGSLLSNSRSYFSSPLYNELHEYLRQIFPGFQVVTTTTTLGHCSALPIMIEENDVIILDQFVHNSLRMAAMLCKSQGTTIAMARHNDMDYLASLVNRLKNDGARNIWYLADGVYSMQGEFLNFTGLTELLNEHEQLFAYVDDAHGMSWTGKNGAGYVLGRHVMHPKMITAVSMCKSFSAFGGISIFPNEDWAERVRFLGQTLIFSAPIPPPILGAAIASAKIHLSEELPIMQHELLEKINYFRAQCHRLNINVKTKDETPIQFIEIGDSNTVYDLNTKLFEQGIFVTAAVYPAMPKKHGGLRVSLTRHLSFEDIDYFLDTLIKFNYRQYTKYKKVQLHTFDAAA